MVRGYRKNTPAEVARNLRQESGFGCANCGHPYIEYHHIVPFSEENHFRTADMVALCGNCHVSVAKMGRDRQYEIKNNPHNIKKSMLNGCLEYDKRDLVFKIGGNFYENTGTIIKYKQQDIISCEIEDGQAKVSINILDKKDKVIFSVLKNQVEFRLDDFWDFKYGHNCATIKYNKRDTALKIDFRGTESKIEGKIFLGGKPVILGINETIMGNNNKIKGCRISNCAVGIHIN